MAGIPPTQPSLIEFEEWNSLSAIEMAFYAMDRTRVGLARALMKLAMPPTQELESHFPLMAEHRSRNEDQHKAGNTKHQ
jgi:hypothetical protein